jgi:hypothetical protein
MKTKLLTICTVAACMMLATGCRFHPRWEDGHRKSHTDGERTLASGKLVSEDRSVGPFHGVRLEGIGTVKIKQAAEASVRVEADDNIISDVKTEVNAGILRVWMEGDSYEHPTVIVNLAVKELDDLNLSGAGDIESDGPLQCDDLRCSLSGAGNITLSGKARSLEVCLSGAGNLSAEELEAEVCDASVSGVGNCDVNVSKELRATVSGVGRIRYSGNPSTVKEEVTGLGKIQKR